MKIHPNLTSAEKKSLAFHWIWKARLGICTVYNVHISWYIHMSFAVHFKNYFFLHMKILHVLQFQTDTKMPRRYLKAHELFNRKKCVQNYISSPWHYKVRQQCLRLLVKAQRKKYSLFCLGTLHEFLKWAKFPSHFRFRLPKNESAENLWLQYKY